MIPLLAFVLTLYLATRLPWPWPRAQTSQRWSHAFTMWLRRQGWEVCDHAELKTVSTRTSEGTLTCITACTICEKTLAVINDTEEAWAREQQREERIERYRAWLERWVAPSLRAYLRFAQWVGGIVITLGLIVWLNWSWVSTSLFPTPACHKATLAALAEAFASPVCSTQGVQP